MGNGMNYDEIAKAYTGLWDARNEDKLNVRYPGAGGECYLDVINRLRPVIIEIERHHSSILVISHPAVQKCIMAYFTAAEISEIPYMDLDMHTLFEMHPGPFGTTVEAVP